MKRFCSIPLLALALGGAAPVPKQEPAPAPSEIVAAAPATDWVAIAAADLMVMDLAPDTRGKPRRVVIQLMPAPFSQGWVGNIRKLVAARWYDGVSVNRVQDNYVVQWGDVSEKKPLPEGLANLTDTGFAAIRSVTDVHLTNGGSVRDVEPNVSWVRGEYLNYRAIRDRKGGAEGYPHGTGYVEGWPVAGDVDDNGYEQLAIWPTHRHAMVGVGRNMPPDTGTGAELYTVIGHAPRHLDRNIALVGRVIEGIEHLSSLPRGTGPLGFYESAEERVPILSVRMGNEVAGLPAYQYLSTESESFALYADARANRRDAFFIRPAGGADICNIPVPVRRVPAP
jgi:peptidylprolyl isomerase